MYTDDSILLFGTYKYKKIKDIPADYLIKLYEKGTHDKELAVYLRNNIDRIRAKFLHLPIAVKVVTFKCLKRTFPTKKDAMNSISIRDSRKKSHKKKPIRAYECKNCSGWHLTSKTVQEYKKEKEKRSAKREGGDD